MPRFLSGVQPSGKLHLGNYFGAVRQHIALQDQGPCFYFIADYHALTTINSPAELRQNTLDVALDYLALGLDPQNIMVEEGDTDTAPYGLGTYASRSTPVAGAAIAIAARRVREKARKIAESILQVGQQSPILVRRDGERFVLVEGLHRLEACKQLGEETILGYLVQARRH